MDITYNSNINYGWVDLTVETGSTKVEETLHSQEEQEAHIQMLMAGIAELTYSRHYSDQDLEDLAREYNMTEEVDSKPDLLRSAVKDFLDSCTIHPDKEHLIHNILEHLED